MTDEEFKRRGAEKLRIAKEYDIVQLARDLGYTPVRKGNGKYMLAEHDSCILFTQTNTYARFSQVVYKGNKSVYEGGSTIDFCCNFANMSTSDAIKYLLSLSYYIPSTSTDYNMTKIAINNDNQGCDFELPEKNDTYKRIYAYLGKSRCISGSVISYFVHEKRLYESKDMHNCVFVSYCDEQPVYAFQRGTITDKPFKGDVFGSNKEVAFPVYRTGSDTVIVFEAVIDLMSYMTLFPDDKSSLHALCCLDTTSLSAFLKEHKNINKVSFSLDNDVRGLRAAENASNIFKSQGYTIIPNKLTGKLTESGCKDVNEYLKKHPVIKKNKSR